MEVINFEWLEVNANKFNKKFKEAVPFEHIVLDDFCNADCLTEAVNSISNMDAEGFNGAVIMFARDHGYGRINFPEGYYRRSIAAYGYTEADSMSGVDVHSTIWYPDKGNRLKSYVGRNIHRLIKFKNKILPSGTSKNK